MPIQHASAYNGVLHHINDDVQSYSIVETDIGQLKTLKTPKYIHTEISSTARIQQRVSALTDDLHIKHWQRADYSATEYRWSKFDKRLKQLQYDNTEYDTLLNDTEWTRSETDQLMLLCTQYDCRWYVIYDRWQLAYKDLYEQHNTPAISLPERQQSAATDDTVDIAAQQASVDIDMTGTSANSQLDVVHSTTTVAAAPITDSLLSSQPAVINHKAVAKPQKLKSLEDLKQRYYSIQRILMKARNSSDNELYRHPLFYNTFDAQHEAGRKDELLKLYQRAPDAVDHVVPYVLEYRKLTGEIKKLKRQVKYDKMKQKNAIALKAGHIHKNAALQKKRKSSVNDDLSIPKDIELRGDQPLAEIPAECQPGADMFPPYGQVYLRSTQLNSMAVLSQRVGQLMEKQLGLLNIRKNGQMLISVPTGVVAEMYDRLRHDIVLLDNLNRYCNEQERKRDLIAANKKQRIR